MPSFLSPLLVGRPDAFLLQNVRTGVAVADRISAAFDSSTRKTGLLGQRDFPEGGALIIAPTNAIHTFFMRFPIDLAFVAKDGRIVKAQSGVRPWRIAWALRAYGVVELPAGTLDRTRTVGGDHLAVIPRGQPG